MSNSRHFLFPPNLGVNQQFPRPVRKGTNSSVSTLPFPPRGKERHLTRRRETLSHITDLPIKCSPWCGKRYRRWLQPPIIYGYHRFPQNVMWVIIQTNGFRRLIPHWMYVMPCHECNHVKSSPCRVTPLQLLRRCRSVLNYCVYRIATFVLLCLASFNLSSPALV